MLLVFFCIARLTLTAFSQIPSSKTKYPWPNATLQDQIFENFFNNKMLQNDVIKMNQSFHEQLNLLNVDMQELVRTEVQKLNNDLFSIKETLEQEIDEVKIDLKDTRKHLKEELNELHKHYNNLKKHYDGLKNFLEILLN